MRLTEIWFSVARKYMLPLKSSGTVCSWMFALMFGSELCFGFECLKFVFTLSVVGPENFGVFIRC